MTCYLRDPRPLPGGRATINIWVIPLAAGEDPLVRLLRCVPGAGPRPCMWRYPTANGSPAT